MRIENSFSILISLPTQPQSHNRPSLRAALHRIRIDHLFPACKKLNRRAAALHPHTTFEMTAILLRTLRNGGIHGIRLKVTAPKQAERWRQRPPRGQVETARPRIVQELMPHDLLNLGPQIEARLVEIEMPQNAPTHFVIRNRSKILPIAQMPRQVMKDRGNLRLP